MNLVNKILKESEGDIFQPRRVDDRLAKLSILDRDMITKYNMGSKIEIWVSMLNRFVPAIITDPPQKGNKIGTETDTWFIGANLYITKEDVPGGIKGRYGIYSSNYINWDVKNQRWNFLGIQFFDYLWSTIWGRAIE